MAVFAPNIAILRYRGKTSYTLRVGRASVTLNDGDYALIERSTAALILRRNLFDLVEGDLKFAPKSKAKKKTLDQAEGETPDGQEQTETPNEADAVGENKTIAASES